MVDGSAIDPEHQISDGVRVGIGATPGDRFTRGRAHPDQAGLSPELTDPESVVHVGRPVAPVRIELSPCQGLDCDGVGHLVSRFDVPSIEPQLMPFPFLVDGLGYCPLWGSEGME